MATHDSTDQSGRALRIAWKLLFVVTLCAYAYVAGAWLAMQGAPA